MAYLETGDTQMRLTMQVFCRLACFVALTVDFLSSRDDFCSPSSSSSPSSSNASRETTTRERTRTNSVAAHGCAVTLLYLGAMGASAREIHELRPLPGPLATLKCGDNTITWSLTQD